MKDMKRALRRHHRQRMIVRARLIRALRFDKRTFDADVREWANRNYDHIKECSCWMCGHRRRWNGPTVQERRMSQKTREDDQ